MSERPISLDAERSIMGAIMLDNSAMSQTVGLTVADFSLDSHRQIFKAMNEMHGDGIPIDLMTLGEFLKSRHQLESVGGSSYLSGLTDGLSHRANIEWYCKIVKEKSQLRSVIIEAHRAIARAESESEKAADILNDFSTASVAIAADTAVKDKDILLDVSKFIRQYHGDIEWRVDGAIEVGTNGMMIGMSGDGKSPAARALAVCLASGLPWLDMSVKRCRTALVSREDYAGTTARFIRRFIEGNGLDEDKLDLKHWLWISSRAQVPSLLLDNPSDLRLLINNLKHRDIQFCILDVLNVLHSKDENDNTEMRKVLAAIDHLRDEVGCQVMVLHHSRKGVDDSTSIAESGRGSSAIAGFAEFKIQIRTVDEEAQVRQVRFKVKAGGNAPSFYWQMTDLDEQRVILERRTDWTPPQQRASQRPKMTM